MKLPVSKENREHTRWYSTEALKALGVTTVAAFLLSSCGDDDPDQAARAVDATKNVEVEVTTNPEAQHEMEEKMIASQIISTFENSTTVIQYGYAENIEDGRGITAGRAGFTSGTHDLLEVVQNYTSTSPGNSLEKYILALEAVDGTDSTEGLDGFIGDWEAAADDPKMRRAQDELVDYLYYDPAMRYADDVGVETPLGKAILFDTIIQHGEGEDADGLPAIVEDVVDRIGKVDGNESEWLGSFLDTRQYHLENAADPATRQGWIDSVDRVEALRGLLEGGELELELPLAWSVYGDNFTLP